MRLAFTSCADPMDSPTQGVWDEIAKQTPDHLVLLGDQIYMDYGISDDWNLLFKNLVKHFQLTQSDFSKNPKQYAPRDYDNEVFAREMAGRYHAQWLIMSKSTLLREHGKPHVHGIWDDHDFGWNGSCGAGADAMPESKQMISRQLFEAFFNALGAVKPLVMPDIPTLLARPVNLSAPNFYSSMTSLSGQCVELAAGKLYLHLLDCRSYRNNDKPAAHEKFTELLGGAQMKALEKNLGRNPAAIHLLASSTTLQGRGEAWERYADRRELRQLQKLAAHFRILVLSGDIHKNSLSNDPLLEATASGAARPPLQNYSKLSAAATHKIQQSRPGLRNFGIVDFNEESLSIEVKLHSEDAWEIPWRIDYNDFL